MQYPQKCFPDCIVFTLLRCFMLKPQSIIGYQRCSCYLIFLVIAGGMGLSVEAGLLGPRGQVEDLWATFSI